MLVLYALNYVAHHSSIVEISGCSIKCGVPLKLSNSFSHIIVISYIHCNEATVTEKTCHMYITLSDTQKEYPLSRAILNNTY